MQISRTQYEGKLRHIESLEREVRRKSNTLSGIYIALFFVLPFAIAIGLNFFQIVWKSDIKTEYEISCVTLFDEAYCD